MENADNNPGFDNTGKKPEVPATMPDNRNVIKLEELREVNGSEPKKPETKSEGVDERDAEEKYLDDPEIRSLIYAERGKIPSFILDDIYENLRGRRVSKKQLKKIISRVKDNLDTESKIEKIDDLYKKLDALEKLLRSFSNKSQKELVKQKEKETEKETEEKIVPQAVIEETDSIIQPETSEFEELEGLSKESESIQEVSGNNGGIKMEIMREGIMEGDLLASDSQRTNGIKLTFLPPDSKRIIFLLKWIEYLVERVGYEELENALDYYVDIGWISEDVLFTILRYAKGIKLYHEKSDWRPVGYLNVQDHIMSLMFIEALRTGKFSREKIMEVEREVFRMKREAMELNGI